MNDKNNERKKIIAKLSRQEIQKKINAANLGKPSNSYISSLSANRQNENKQNVVRDKIIRNAKNKKRFANVRPQTITDTLNLNNVSNLTPQIINFKTPSWFTNTNKVDVSVIVPMYKSKKVVLDLIKNWPLECKLNYEIIFVDDCCPEKCHDVIVKAWANRKEEIKNPIGKLIGHKTNAGYGFACNTGASVASGKYLIFLNADTIVSENWIEPMIELFEDSKVGIVGNLQIKKGGSWDETIDSAGSEWRWGDDSFVHIGRHSYKKQSIPNPFSVKNAPEDILEISEREMVTGCCFAIPKTIFDYIGGFNPNYKIGYWEDSEICMNVRELGYKIMFTPKSIIYHKLGHTASGGHKFMTSNIKYFKNKWVNSGRLHSLLIPPESPPLVKRILIKRMNAHGDALIASGVCAALKKKYPDVKIAFSTLHIDVIQNNPYIDECVELHNIDQVKYDVFYNLDLAYEWRPNVNILDAYAEFCGVKREDCVVYLPQEEYPNLPENFIVVHAGKTDWVGRDWPTENWASLTQKLIDMGENIICFGKYTEGDIPCTLDLRGKMTIPQMHWILRRAKLFIGIDSFPMHVAQAADANGISFFGCVKPELRIFTKTMTGITAKGLDCLGCHHLNPAPSTTLKVCKTRNLDCISGVSVEDMFQLVMQKINKNSLPIL